MSNDVCVVVVDQKQFNRFRTSIAFATCTRASTSQRKSIGQVHKNQRKKIGVDRIDILSDLNKIGFQFFADKLESTFESLSAGTISKKKAIGFAYWYIIAKPSLFDEIMNIFEVDSQKRIEIRRDIFPDLVVAEPEEEKIYADGQEEETRLISSATTPSTQTDFEKAGRNSEVTNVTELTWKGIVDDVPRTGVITVLRKKHDAKGLASFCGDKMRPAPTLSLNDEFKFLVNTNEVGYGIVLQIHKNNTYIIPYSRYQVHFSCGSSKWEFPSQYEAFADRYLFEDSFLGNNTFLFLICSKEKEVREIADSMESERQISCLNNKQMIDFVKRVSSNINLQKENINFIE